MTARQKILDANPRACAHCPWRLSNQGKRHPHGFYSARNLRRLWAGLRSGEAPGMTCHPTDPEMADFEGYENLADREVTHECAGAVVLVTREAKRFEAICKRIDRGEVAGNAFKQYRLEAPRGMTRAGLIEVIMGRFLFGDTPLGGPKIHVISDTVNDPDVGYPPLGDWDPAILKVAR